MPSRRLRSQSGQASVELVGALPFVLLAGLVAWQIALAGHTAWLCAQAARAAARAEVVGRDAETAARSALPRSLERDLRVEAPGDGSVRVRLRMPLVVRGWRGPVTLGASARLGEGR